MGRCESLHQRNHSFHKHFSCLGPVSCSFPQGSPQGVAVVWWLLDNRYCSPSWVPLGLTGLYWRTAILGDYDIFLSEQCKEIEENNRMGKTRDLLKIIRDTKETFYAKMGTTKDRNSVDLKEAKDIKTRWQEYTEELHKKDLNNPDNHDGVITHLETDILECEVKWALRSITIKLAEVMEFQLSYFKC